MALRHWLSTALATAIAIRAGTASAGTPRIMRLENGHAEPTSPFASGKLQYFGGHVISNVNIIAVSWGTSVDASYMTNLEGFYKTITVSPWIDWMSEYDTIGQFGAGDGLPGSNQHIGRGSYGGAVVLSSLQNTSTALTDSDIETEILYQLSTGVLPPPKSNLYGDVDTLYMIDFPSGISITIGGGSHSCSNFGAYHSTFVYKGKSVAYGVHPYCGYGFGTATMVHSHELAESMTDTEIGLGVSMSSGRPAAWVDAMAGGQEAGDLCNWQSATVSGYTVQKIWSNYAAACVSEIPLCDGSLSPPACRPCNFFDSGFSCTGSTPACATTGPSQGRCVLCTSSYPGQCTGTTAVCDDATNTCVGCMTNGDCRGASPVCETSTKTCRACALDTECATGTVCDVSGDASKGSCVQCNSDMQCASGMKCSSRTCVPAAPPPPDAGAAPDSSTPDVPAAPTDSSGGCAITGGSNRSSAGALAFLLLALLARRRR